MKILAVDTATKSCSVAIIEAGSLSAELTTLRDQTHSKHLMELIHRGLGMAGISAAELDGLAVTIGPGSFTGLRIGVSTIKGLAHALDKPVVGISSLDALAWQCADRSYLICALLDARKGEVYSATYRYSDDTLTPKSPENASAPGAALQKIKEPCVFIGSGAQLYRRNISTVLGDLAHFAPKSQNIIRASSVAFLSMQRFETLDTVAVAELVPHYIRKSDAELSF
ncbi:MAG: tRNA (adenosine(37)-N6)-threonylcarbamoyltransferase complex dimerization subunit type 1 TsaB [Desulfobacterales bacterium]|jgi:tRNA threonylcarbamoyladenosine biosynthesis protein TsaB|nr:tRNA (adenosine(37)-N6)-threonylcarbamoyltransferase complex dimerization subunit type 1 TsaB [Desulfobacterales bacterium]